ncbi:MAG: DNA polymerase I [Thermaerobacter sp.]|nr:DNA polymerase I [Thermaerobacter sp.]
MPKQLLIDGHSLLFRAFHAMPPLTAQDGTPTGAVYGFFSMLLKVMEEQRPDRVVVAFDAPSATFRHDLYEAYKANRSESPQDFRAQVPLVQELLAALGIPVLAVRGFEADDVLGTLARMGSERRYETVIVSGDRDLLQLVDAQITVLLTTRNGITGLEIMTPAAVRSKLGVDPVQVPDLKGLEGDSSDNIPGVAGIGKKSALRLLEMFGSVENMLTRLHEIDNPRWQRALTGQEAAARRYRDLAVIVRTVPIEWPEMEEPLRVTATPQAEQMLDRLALQGVRRRLGGATASPPAEDPHPASLLTPAPRSLAAYSAIAADEAVLPMDRPLVLWADGQSVWIADPEAGWTAEWTGRPLPEAAYWGWGIKDVYRRLATAGQPWPHFVEDGKLQAYLLNSERARYDLPAVAAESGWAPFSAPAEMVHGVAELVGEQRQALLARSLDTVYREVEMPLARVLAKMEAHGVRVASDRLTELGTELTSLMAEEEREIFELAGEKFNINSPQQLAEVLFGRLGLPTMKKTKTGYSTDADTLYALAPLHPVVEKVLGYRQVVKIKGTYVDGLLPLIGPDGRVHTTFHQTVTGTGRLSSSDPNLQNIPVREALGRRLRGVFLPGAGRILLAADYSQIELRLLAHLSGDENLIQAFWDGEDIHARTAAEIFGLPRDAVDAVWRGRAKAVNFGIIYGISDFGLARDTGVSRREAKDYIERYFARYPRLKEYFDGVLADARRDGEVRTILGRRRPLADIRASNRMRRQYAERMAINTVIQGSAADLIKVAMVRIDRHMDDGHWESAMILQVHDELIWEAVPAEMLRLKELAVREMVRALPLKVPLVVEVKAGEAWNALEPYREQEG